VENVSRTVQKAIDILEVFLRKDGNLSLTEIGKATGLNVATSYRLASTLVKRGYLSQHQKKGTYSLGMKMLDYNYAIRKNLKFIDFAYLSLSKLSRELNESVYLAVLDADMSLVVEEIGITEDLRINSPVGKRLPLHCIACGKILLASMSEEERKAYYSRNALQSFTKNTITNIARLEEELAIVKTEGVGFNNEEYRMGLWGAAAPIYNGGGNVIASAGIIVPIADINAAYIQKFGTAIKSCVGQISQIISRIS